MKRIFNFLFMVLFVAALFTACGSGGGGGVAAPLSSAKAITAFSFTNPAATGTINESAKTIAVTMPYGTNVTSLVATFATTSASVTVNSILQVSGTTPNDFTSSVAYTVTAADGSTTIYTVSITIAVSPILTGINITAGDGYTIINWDSINGITGQSAGIAIARKTAAGFYSIVGSVPIDQTTFIDTGLTPNTTYYYKFYKYTSYDWKDISSYTNEYNITTLSSNTTPIPPSSLTATAVDGWTIALSWLDNSNNEDGFTVERSTDNINFTPVTNTYANVTSFRDDFVVANTLYYYRVKAFNTFDASSYSPVASATTPTISPTTLGGGIIANMTLSLANSPYLVSSYFTLAPGYTLTIEPGVHIRFAPSTTMEIRGQLTAVGTSNNPIIFTAADPTNSSETSWNGIHIANNFGGNATIQHAEISHAASGIWVDRDSGVGPVNIYDSMFNTNSSAVTYYSPFKVIIYRSTFLNNEIAAGDADKIIAYSKFQNNTYGMASAQYPGIYGAERISVYYSLFTGNTIALWGGNGSEVRYSTIQHNGIGVKPHFINMSLFYNTIANNNDKGVIVSSYNTGSQILTATIHHSNIFGNTNYNIVNTNYCYVDTPAADLDATNNWWGTTSSGAIDDKIWDFFDDASLGIVNYAPTLTGPVDTIP